MIASARLTRLLSECSSTSRSERRPAHRGNATSVALTSHSRNHFNNTSGLLPTRVRLVPLRTPLPVQLPIRREFRILPDRSCMQSHFGIAGTAPTVYTCEQYRVVRRVQSPSTDRAQSVTNSFLSYRCEISDHTLVVRFFRKASKPKKPTTRPMLPGSRKGHVLFASVLSCLELVDKQSLLRTD